MDFQLPLMPDQASTFAPEVDALYLFLWAVSAFFTVLIFVLIVYLAIKYRRRSEGERPAPTIESLRLELTWTIIPLVIVMVIFFWGARVFFMVYRAPGNALNIHVVGKQWMWKIQHPEGIREINALHVPVGQPVQLTMSSQDVIHSFYIPAFRTKMDVVPGRYTSVWFTPTRVGEFHLFCAEYCGTQHSGMIGKVYVMEPEDYQAWLAGAIPDEPVDVAGARLFRQFGCATCHSSQAPTMAGLFGSEVQLADGRTVLADEQYIRDSILNSTQDIVAGYSPVMPSFRGQISEEQLLQLTAYIKSMAAAVTPAEGGPGMENLPPGTDPMVPGKSRAVPGIGPGIGPGESR